MASSSRSVSSDMFQWAVHVCQILIKTRPLSPSDHWKREPEPEREPETELEQEEQLLQLSIFVIPTHVRECNSIAYTPQVITIGPYWHGKLPDGDVVSFLENYKKQCVRFLLFRHHNDEMLAHKLLFKCLTEMKELCGKMRNYYSPDISSIDDYQLAQWMLLDGCFIIWFLLMHVQTDKALIDQRIRWENDVLARKYKEQMSTVVGSDSGKISSMSERMSEYGKLAPNKDWDKKAQPMHGKKWMKKLILLDLLKLQNQIPLVVVKSLFSILRHPVEHHSFFIERVALCLFQELSGVKPSRSHFMPDEGNSHHLLHLFSLCTYLPQSNMVGKTRAVEGDPICSVMENILNMTLLQLLVFTIMVHKRRRGHILDKVMRDREIPEDQQDQFRSDVWRGLHSSEYDWWYLEKLCSILEPRESGDTFTEGSEFQEIISGCQQSISKNRPTTVRPNIGQSMILHLILRQYKEVCLNQVMGKHSIRKGEPNIHLEQLTIMTMIANHMHCDQCGECKSLKQSDRVVEEFIRENQLLQKAVRVFEQLLKSQRTQPECFFMAETKKIIDSFDDTVGSSSGESKLEKLEKFLYFCILKDDEHGWASWFPWESEAIEKIVIGEFQDGKSDACRDANAEMQKMENWVSQRVSFHWYMGNGNLSHSQDVNIQEADFNKMLHSQCFNTLKTAWKRLEFNKIKEILQAPNVCSILKTSTTDNPELPVQWIPRAAELQRVGIKFERRHYNKMREEMPRISFTDVTFENGVLKIPHLCVSEDIRTLFSNLVVFEQLCPYIETRITAYVVFMDCLVDTAEDVRVLQSSGIIDNRLGTDDAVADLFNNFKTHIDYTVSDSNYLEPVFEQINSFHRKKYHRWIATFKRNHCATPWMIASFILASILLVLTALQAIYAVIAYHHPPRNN